MGILKIPRISTTDRTPLVLEEGELVYDITNDKIYKGDGSTAGGIEVGAGGLKYDLTTGNGAAYVSDLSIAGYFDGDAYLIEFHVNNSSITPTISIGGLAAKTIVKNANDALAVGDILAGKIYLISYDGTNFQLTTLGGGGSGDMTKAIYDVDNDGVVDSAERTEIIVRNSTGSPLIKGQIVYLSGATGNRPNAILADASDETTSSKTIGMVVADIPNNADGYVAVNGTLHDLNTNSFAAGNTLWLSATTPGGMVANTPPAKPNHSVFIGYVARAHPTQGRIVLAIQNGYELDELHNVLITGIPTTGELLRYDATDNLWKNTGANKTLTLGGNLTTAGAFNTTLTSIANTSLNLPVTGNVVTTSTLFSNGTSTVSSGTPSNTTFLRGDGAWATAFASGTLTPGTGRRLAIYSGTTNSTALTDAYIQSSPHTLNVILQNTAITASRTLTIPVTNADADFVMTQGTQIIAGAKTFSNDAIFSGDIAVNGGDITTTSTGTATIFNTNALGLNIGGAATSSSIGLGALSSATGSQIYNFATGSHGSVATSTASTISGTTLTIGGTVTGTFAVGMVLNGANVTAGTTITAGGPGGAGTYTINISQTIATSQSIGATAPTTKTVNIGTLGLNGSVTNVNIGSAVAGATGTTTINSTAININGSNTISFTPTATTASLILSGGGTSTTKSQIEFTGGSMRSIDFGNVGIAPPNITTRSGGTKLILNRSFSSGTLTDYAIGIATSLLWFSIPSAISTYSFRWYAGETSLLTLRGDGLLSLTGAMNISGNLTVNPYIILVPPVASPGSSRLTSGQVSFGGTDTWTFPSLGGNNASVASIDFSQTFSVTHTFTAPQLFPGTGVRLRGAPASSGYGEIKCEYGLFTSGASNIFLVPYFGNFAGTYTLVVREAAQTFSADQTFGGNIIINNGFNIQTGGAAGTQIATATNQKIGFHGSSPSIQRANASQVAVVTTTPTLNAYGYTLAQATAIITLVNEMRTALVEKGLIKGSA